MEKNKEWLKAQIKDEELELKSVYDNYVPYEKVLIADDVNELIDQFETENVIVPQFVIDYIKECKSKDFTLCGAFQYATGNFEKWIFEDNYKKVRAEIFAKVWLNSDTIQKEEEN